MTNRRERTLSAACLVVIAVAGAAEATEPGISVINAWVRPSIGETGATALYLSLRNEGPEADELLSVTTPAAGMSELHASKVDSNGVVSMQPIVALPLPSGTTVTFEPKGSHIMLMGLSRPLSAGEHISLELHFKRHAAEAAEAVVSMTPPGP